MDLQKEHYRYRTVAEQEKPDLAIQKSFLSVLALLLSGMANLWEERQKCLKQESSLRAKSPHIVALVRVAEGFSPWSQVSHRTIKRYGVSDGNSALPYALSPNPQP